MDPLGLQADIAKTQAALNAALDRIAALEAQTAKDVSAIADKVLNGVLPEVQAMRVSLAAGIDKAVDSVNQLSLVASASVTEALALARRIDGAKFILAPEPPPAGANSVTVQG
jgi:hypothetical protein